jgi:hypothetical protein
VEEKQAKLVGSIAKADDQSNPEEPKRDNEHSLMEDIQGEQIGGSGETMNQRSSVQQFRCSWEVSHSAVHIVISLLAARSSISGQKISRGTSVFEVWRCLFQSL